MMLGKRPGYPIKRTASMTEFTFDLNTTTTTDQVTSDPFKNTLAPTTTMNQGLISHRMLSPSLSMSPRNLRRNSADFSAEFTHFLQSCLLCKKKLVPGRDIYMYRGDSAFCSAECREKQMKQDERKEKCSLSASKKESSAAATSVIKSQFSA